MVVSKLPKSPSRAALVTGGSCGIGKMIAAGFLTSGRFILLVIG
jgi:NAD(P)-dependent dehydrogenase (short-subunit alcohol dehydrogenase family)